MQGGGRGLEIYPHLLEFLWDSLDEEHCLPSHLPVSPPSSSSTIGRGHPD